MSKINKFKKFILGREKQETDLLLKLDEAIQMVQDIEHCIKVSVRIKNGYKDIIKKCNQNS